MVIYIDLLVVDGTVWFMSLAVGYSTALCELSNTVYAPSIVGSIRGDESKIDVEKLKRIRKKGNHNKGKIFEYYYE